MLQNSSEFVIRVRPAALARALLVVVVALGVLAAAAWVWRAPILVAIGNQLVHADPLEPSDALVMLAGGGVERQLEAADLYARGLAPGVLLTRERVPAAVTEAMARGVGVEPSVEFRARVLRDLGVPAEAIVVLEPVVASTADEAAAALEWARRHGARSIIVVTASFHTARASYIFRRTFRRDAIVVRVAPAAASDFQPETWWTDRGLLREGLIEWQKTVYYRLVF